MSARTPVLMLGLDAVELERVARLDAASPLPALAALRERGCFGALSSPALTYAGAVWPSFYCGRDVPWHGIFHNKLWRPDAMRCEVPSERWIRERPFWESLGRSGLRACIVDVPMVLGKPRPIDGVCLSGWSSHDRIERGAWPEGLWRELRRRHGAPVMPAECFGPQSARGLVALRDVLLRSVDQLQRIAADLLARERWDFACVVFGATHRAGHYLWDLSQLEAGALRESARALLEDALLEVYRATDRAIARLLEAVSPDTLVIAFALHGMGPNPGWADLVPPLLAAPRATGHGGASSASWLYRLKRRLPLEWIRPVLRRLPGSVSDALVPLWSSRMHDWSRTRSFAVPADHAGYFRINLRGRERGGIVEAGAEYEDACAALEELLGGLRDRDTGLRIAPEIVRAYARAPHDATYRSLLPDLVVPWQGPPASRARALECDALPGHRFAVPATLPSGRSGNHTGRGWFVAAGPGVAPGSTAADRSILDLAPTVLRVLGAEPDRPLDGAPIEWPRSAHGS